MKKVVLLFILLLSKGSFLFSQAIPSREENFDYIATFGKQAKPDLGDDDFVQTYFFAISTKQKSPFYIRVFDPDCGGKHDQRQDQFNTKTKFSVYGGLQCFSLKDAKSVNPVGNYRSGILINSKVFSNDTAYDDKYYSFGPINPQEGEFDADIDAYVFKLIVEGLDGDDGNMYRLFLSSSKNENQSLEGANAFAYEVCFKMKSNPKEVGHFYPFVDKKVISMKQHNFDFDFDGAMRVTSVSKKLNPLETSGDGIWANSLIKIDEAERNTSLDVQFVKKSTEQNVITFYLLNQYNEAVPFFSAPIGGVPKYKYKVDVIIKTSK